MDTRTNSLDDLAWFIRIAEAGSLSRASRVLDVPKSTLSQRLCRLEEAWGISLALRNSRSFCLTDAGRQLIDEVGPLVHRLQRTSMACLEGGRTMRGLVRLAAPVWFGGALIAPRLGEFLQANPGVRLEMELTDRPVNLHEEGLDFCIRHGPLSLSNLKARKLASFTQLLCASPQYLQRYGALDHPSELLHRSFLAPSRASTTLRFQHSAHECVQINLLSRLVLNSAEELIRLAQQSVGVALLPDELVREAIEDGTLVNALPGWSLPPQELHLLYPDERHKSPLVRELMDFLCSDEPARVKAEEAQPS